MPCCSGRCRTEQPNRLVWVAERNDPLKLQTFAASVLNYLSWKEQSKTFSQLGAFGFTSFNLTGQGEPEQFRGGTLSPSLLPLLGIRPILGRSFRDEEERPGAAKVVMISEALWKRRFGSDRSIVGRTLTSMAPRRPLSVSRRQRWSRCPPATCGCR